MAGNPQKTAKMQNTIVDKSCAVCFEGFNKSTRACTTCPYCSVEICRGCLQQYLLNDINIVPICVNTDCKREWTRDFLDKELTSTFRLHTYKAHREKVLFDRERSKLPATQEDAAAYRVAKQAFDAGLEEAKRLDEQINELQRQLARKRVEYRRYMTTVDTYGRTRPAAEGAAAAAQRAAPAAFVRPCPATDCRGFLSTAWKCSICDMYTCPDCHELKGPNREDPGHTCDPNNIATARLLARDTKPCPKCGAGITKLEGCDQMWCTVCNTGFNWRTGAVAAGPVHNPHYFEWLAANPDAPRAAAGPPQGDCGVALDRQIMQKLAGRNDRLYLYAPTNRNLPAASRYLIEAWRLMRENESQVNRQNRNYDDEFHDLRVKYMLNMINDDEYKKVLQTTEKNALHKQANRQVYEVFVNSVRDTIRQVLTNNNITHKTLMEQVHQIHVYCTEEFKQIGKRFGRAEHSIIFRGNFDESPAPAAPARAAAAINSDYTDEDE
jgi:hypothetical protein